MAKGDGTPTDATAAAGLEQQQAAHQAAAAAAAAPGSGASDGSAHTITDLFKAVTGLRSELLERIGEVEREAKQRRPPNDGAGRGRGGGGSDGGSGSGSDGGSERSSRSSTSSQNTGSDSDASLAFCPINEDNPHWSARERASEQDREPRRYSMYGNKTHDALAAGRHEGGGMLGFSLGYAEATSLYQHAVVSYLERIMDAGLDARNMRAELALVLNSSRSIYNLVNTHRELLVTKARSVRPGASDYDKAEAKFIERSMDERDFGTEDVPAAIADLKADFAYSARRADLNTLSKRAGGGGGGGGLDRDRKGRDDDDDGGSRRKRGKRGGKAHGGGRDDDGRRGSRRDGERRDGKRRESSRERSSERSGQRRDGTRRNGDGRDGKRRDGASGGARDGGRERGNTSRDDARRGSGGRDGDRGGGGQRSDKGKERARDDHGSRDRRRGARSGSDSDASY